MIPVYGPPGDRIAELTVKEVGKRAETRGRDRHAEEPRGPADRSRRRRTSTERGEETLAKLTAAGKAKIAAAQLEAEQATADEEKDKEALNLQIAVLAKPTSSRPAS